MVLLVVSAVFVPSVAGATDPSSTTTTTRAPTTTSSSSSTTTTTTVVSTSSSSSSSTTTSTTGALQPPTTMSAAQSEALKAASGQYDELTTEEIDLVKRLAAQDDKSKYLASQVDQLNKALGSTQHEVDDAQAAVDRADAAATDIENRLAESQDALQREQKRLQQQAVDAYIGGGMGGGSASAAAVLRSSTLNDVGSSVVYSDAVITDQRHEIDRVTDLRNQVASLQGGADGARDAADKARAEVDDRRKALVGQRDQQQALKDQVDAATKEQQELLKEVAAKRADAQQRVLLLSQTSDGISGTLAKRQKGEMLPLVTTGIFLPPIPHPTINSPFGYRNDPLGGPPSLHPGVDLAGVMGTPIRAAGDGVVVIASEQGGYGNCTVIDHGSGLGTLYGHQSQFLVQVGDTVKRGQVIGLVGSTGYSTGPHLHWEVREFGQVMDPLPFMGPG